MPIATGVASAAAGAQHSLYVTAGGALYGIGYNGYGQIAGYYEAGDLLAGLDLGAQPVASFTAEGKSLLDSESGVELWPYCRPERMTLRTQSSLTSAGYLTGAARKIQPAGYVVGQVYATNSGNASATVIVRAGSSSGSTMASGIVAATGLPVLLSQSLIAANIGPANGGIIHVTGGSATSPIDVQIELRKVKAR